MNKRYINQRMTLSVQGFLLKHKYPESYVAVKNNRLIWFGKIKPTPLSRVYNVRLVCEKGNKPKVFLYGKHIIGIERDDFPHRYNKNLEKQEVELCLNMPIEFNYSLRIIDTIIPWIQEWLYYYEIWLATDEWRGGGGRAYPILVIICKELLLVELFNAFHEVLPVSQKDEIGLRVVKIRGAK